MNELKYETTMQGQAVETQEPSIEKLERAISDMRHVELQLHELLVRVQGGELSNSGGAESLEPRAPTALALLLQDGPARINSSSARLHTMLNELKDILLN